MWDSLKLSTTLSLAKGLNYKVFFALVCVITLTFSLATCGESSDNEILDVGRVTETRASG